MKKLYEVELNSKGAPNFSTAVEAQERKTGEWIPLFNGKFTGGGYWFRCSNCGRTVPEVRNGGLDFCPQCGSYNGDYTTTEMKRG